MLQIEQEHRNDDYGNPAGGVTSGVGFVINWQDGPLNMGGERREPTGAFVETIICAVMGRIEYYQNTKFHCVENAVALGALKVALEVLRERTRGREDRGVEGTHEL